MDMYAAIAEPTRRTILEMLAREGELPASEIYDHFTASPPAISQHLKILREADLVTVEKHAQRRVYSINPHSIKQIEEWIQKMTKHWNDRFDALDKLLIEEKKKLKKEVRNK